MLSFEVLLAFNVIIWLVAIYILIRIISAARRSNSKKSRRIEHHSSLPDTKYRQRKKRPNFLTKMIPFSSERRNSATQGLVEFKALHKPKFHFRLVVNITTPEQKMPLIEQNNGEGKGSAIMVTRISFNHKQTNLWSMVWLFSYTKVT